MNPVCQRHMLVSKNSNIIIGMASEVPSKDKCEREGDTLMEIVPLKKVEVASGSVSLFLGGMSEVKPGWPLLRHAMVCNTTSSQIQQVRQISVVQWVMRLPSRYGLFIENLTRKDYDSSNHDKGHQLDGEGGAIVPAGNEAVSVPSSRDCISRSLPKELEGLHEKHSTTCRLFKFRELELATSNFRQRSIIDFGLARWASPNSTYITFGYLAPEYFMYGKVNKRIDVYAYGVVLVALLSGRKPISSNCLKGQQSLVMGVLKLLRGDHEAVKWARLQVNASEGPVHIEVSNSVEGFDAIDDETISQSNMQSHLDLAMLGVEEDWLSLSSIEQRVSLEDYLCGRWSHSSSLD
ncbi:hypothetical protein SASPL_110612 [Salvia splendens]|uniref:Protein kinase domain-containing protein n=1 Tax=Salvia splendens TaxID=180675 RepID=A0A8X9A4D5_SALSN|nr:hypothetical protein SASPL_110612 [Salvia splendens]